jgi:hypothetical protein
MADQWHKIEDAEHPYTAVAYSTDGATRIEAIQDVKDIAAEHRSIA